MKFEAEHEGRTVPVEVTGGAGRYTVVIDGSPVTVDAVTVTVIPAGIHSSTACSVALAGIT